MTDERRRQILDAAGSVIAERGLCETRVADVADRVGISPALILYYFPSKERLLAEALAFRDQQFFDDIAGRLGSLESASARLVELIEASCPPKDVDGGEEWLLWLDLWARARHDPELSEARTRMDRAFRDAIAEIVRTGEAAGEFAAIDADLFALHLSALIDGLAIQVVLDAGEVDPGVMRDLCCAMAASALDCELPPGRTRRRRAAAR
jgi:AcrR family transcriptional regulator